MAISKSIEEFFIAHPLHHETLAHAHSVSSLSSANTAHIPGGSVAKAVLLKAEDSYLLAVLPATSRLHLGHLHHLFNRHVGLATEEEVAEVFADCETGAIPPTGLLYDIDTVVDDALLDQNEIYFEAGDHEHLIHMGRKEFGKMMGDATHLQLS